MFPRKVLFRCSVSDFATLERLGRAQGEPISTVLRALIRRAGESLPALPPPAPVAATVPAKKGAKKSKQSKK